MELIEVLLMSMAAISILLAGLFVFKPPSVVCVRWGSSVDVEYSDLKPCCEGESGICGVGYTICLLYTSPSPRDKRQSRMPSSA